MPTKQHSIIPERKDTLQQRAARDILGDYLEYRKMVAMDGTVDDRRKLTELQIRLIGAEVEKKVDPNANLPVFNFIINGGSQPMQLTPHMPVLDVHVTEVSATVPEAVEPEQANPDPLGAAGLDALLSFLEPS